MNILKIRAIFVLTLFLACYFVNFTNLKAADKNSNTKTKKEASDNNSKSSIKQNKEVRLLQKENNLLKVEVKTVKHKKMIVDEQMTKLEDELENLKRKHGHLQEKYNDLEMGAANKTGDSNPGPKNDEKENNDSSWQWVIPERDIFIIILILVAISGGIGCIIWKQQKLGKQIKQTVNNKSKDTSGNGKYKQEDTSTQLTTLIVSIIDIKKLLVSTEKHIQENVQTLQSLDSKMNRGNQEILNNGQALENVGERMDKGSQAIQNAITGEEDGTVCSSLNSIKTLLNSEGYTDNLKQIASISSVSDLQEMSSEIDKKQKEIIDAESKIKEFLNTNELILSHNEEINNQTNNLKQVGHDIKEQLDVSASTTNALVEMLQYFRLESIEFGQGLEIIDKQINMLYDRKEKYKTENQDQQKRIEKFTDKINSLNGQNESLVQEVAIKDKLQKTLDQYTSIIPKKITDIFNNKYPLDQPKNRSLFLLLISLFNDKDTADKPEMRKSLNRFDSMIYESFNDNIDLLTSFRQDVSKLLNEEILMRFYSVEWPEPGCSFNKDLHVADSEFGNDVILLSKSAILRDNDRKVISNARVDTKQG